MFRKLLILWALALFAIPAFSAPVMAQEEKEAAENSPAAEEAQDMNAEEAQKAAEKEEQEKKAQELEALDKEIAEESQKALEEQQKLAQDTFEMVSEIVKDLEPNNQKHFFMIYTNYNLVETVKIVQKDVGVAVDECAANNPDMENKLRNRYKDWNDAVNPLIDEAEGNINNMVIAQDYIPSSKIKKVFKAVDKTRKKTNEMLEKIPVTSKEACDFLYSQMDKTQENMTKLLQSTLVTFPQRFPNAEDEAPEEESNDAKAAKEEL